jgi:hypothetical protein
MKNRADALPAEKEGPMKTRALIMAGVMVLTFAASTQVARAQDHLVVNVPFDFVAGSTKLPAGEYSVKVQGPLNTLLLIRRAATAESAIIPTNAVVANEPRTESKLVFNRYGDRYFLSQIWTEGNNQGRQVPKSAREKEMAQMAKIDDRSQVILVASLAPTTR